MPWRRILIVISGVVALAISLNLLIIGFKFQSLQSYYEPIPNFMPNVDIAEGSYPFFWQKNQQERLRYLLLCPIIAPTGKDELSNALYLQYAERFPSEKVFKEGISREPNNALYHYLLADLYINQNLIERSEQNDKKTDNEELEYIIKDRERLDKGMQELAIGLKLPYKSHRGILLNAQLNALPPAKSFDDRINEITILASMNFPEFSKFRKFARVNSFYLSTLLSEGKRKEAEPFLHTGEHLVVQVSNDSPVVLISQLVAHAVGSISKKNNALVCRKFGLQREAEQIEKNQELLIAKLRDWKDHGRKIHSKNVDFLIENNSGIVPSIIVPLFGPQQEGLITKETLAPSRLIDYILIEKIIASALCIISFLLLVFAGLKYWRYKRIKDKYKLSMPEIKLTVKDWLRIFGYGLLTPLALYLLYISIPAISWREYGIRHSIFPFSVSLGILMLWTLFVPPVMAVNIIKKRCIDLDIKIESKFSRFVSVFFTVLWVPLSLTCIMIPISWAWLSLAFANPDFCNSNAIIRMTIVSLVCVLICLIMLFIKLKNDETLQYKLAISNAMISIYIILTLFFASFVPICTAFERHYIQTDKLMSPMREGNDIAMTVIEGKVVLMLRNYVREGAAKLGIPWE